MILSNALSRLLPQPKAETMSLPELVGQMGYNTASGQVVDSERAKRISVAYRCKNIISDDVAKMPLQTFVKRGSNIERVQPNAMLRNLPYLLEIAPNRRMSPFLFKKLMIEWLIFWGNAYLWSPIGWPRELHLLPADVTIPVLDGGGNLWYRTQDYYGKLSYLPSTEVLHLMINPDRLGYFGRSVLSYAKETLGRQLGAYETQNKFYAQGLNAAGILWVNGDLNKEARGKMRSEYESAMSGSEQAGRLAIFDQKIVKFESVSIKPVDAQFLEGIAATDMEVANFFGVPAYKLNMGKQSYESNAQQDLEYLKSTLDPYLVQVEQTAALKWLTDAEQVNTYHRFNRDVLLRTDAKTRAEYLNLKIQYGQITPNEAREVDDMSAFDDGNYHYMPSNMQTIEPAGRTAPVV